MIEIKTARYINTDDVEKLTGKHWGDFEFAQMAENDAYQVMSCSDDYLEELYEDLEWETGKEGMLPGRTHRCHHEGHGRNLEKIRRRKASPTRQPVPSGVAHR